MRAPQVRALRPGSRVRVVAPAGPVPAEKLHSGLTWLRDWGLEVTVADHVTDRHPDLPYLAGTDTDRAADLQAAWCDPDVDAVLCARGGYGATRVLEHLDWVALAAAAPKPLVGSSDITALHRAFAVHLGVSTVFGPMPATDAFADTANRDALHRALFHPDRPTLVTGGGALVPGRARGVTVGGNASLLAALTGTPAGTPVPDTIVLLEDVDESPYRVDRILTQLGHAGWWRHAAGVALGSWTGCGPEDQLRALFTDRLGDLGIPVAYGLPFGHGPTQATIRLGAPAELDADTGRLTVH